MMMEKITDTVSDSGLLIATFLLDNALFGIDTNQIQEVVQIKN
jgi:chemotaxis signal transduction protein